jgi:catechol 2,3-dioxygenase-like lactoylglutathione lyase family enzyme
VAAAQLDFIGITTDDMARSLAFYRLLGVDIPEPEDGQDHVEAVLASGLRLGWDTTELVQSFDPGWQPANGGARTSLAFLCDAPAAVDDLYAALEQAGYPGRKGPWDAFWGQRYALAVDPDGNVVSLFAALA